ncbi:MAG: hypothetical protein EXS38_07305 [Opitutus sp.]|nr:hypothetical protein [Opitutus sp.]
MGKWLFQLLSFCLVGATAFTAEPDPAATTESPPASEPKAVRVFVIPVRDEVGTALHYIIRRGLKDAMEAHADAVVFDMKTPGGALDATFEIMETIGKFSGRTLTFVNTEAMSAGAFIAATTDEIWFAPTGIIGAAAPVSGGGQDVEATMKLKIVSYLKARMRAMSEGKGYRGQVISAMIDADVELKIEDKVLKGKGELLSLTAVEAMKKYGEPPQALLGAGLANSIADLIAQRYVGARATVTTMELTWSEQLAVWLTSVTPILMGLGMLALFIEFKTPGFGIFGITGITLLAIVFLANFVAGLSGHEPILVFALGVLLIGVELFFFPGTVVMALTSFVLMLGSLVWSMADVWPGQPVVFSGDLLLVPLQKLLIALVLAGVGLLLIARFLPTGWIWQRLAVGGAVEGAGVPPTVTEEMNSLVGREGVAVTSLFPSGQVDIDGHRYEARLEVDFAEAGTRVRVIRRTDFNLIVEIVRP